MDAQLKRGVLDVCVLAAIITSTGRQRIEDFKNEWKEIMEIYSFIERGEQV